MDAKEMIEIINSFVLNTEFFHWLAKDDFFYKSLYEMRSSALFEYMGECHIQNRQVSTIWGSFLLHRTSKHFCSLLSKPKVEPFHILSELKQLEKKSISSIETESTYTIVSELFYRGQRCGNCWEIFEFGPLIQVYTAKAPSLTAIF
jgi:hypothetical protein